MILDNLNHTNGAIAFWLAIVAILTLSIAITRFLLGVIYATGNQNDSLLLGWMKQAKVVSWQGLQQQTGLSSANLWLLRDGNTSNLTLNELNQVAKTLAIPLGDFLDKLGLSIENAELETRRQECQQLQYKLQQLGQEKEKLFQEGVRLNQQLQQQQVDLSDEIRAATFERLQTLLSNYPSINKMVELKPELPAKDLISVFAPLDNLLKEWGYETIGTPWEQVTYNPQIHQPDASDIVEGELVYIHFVGYQHQGKILFPAKVSRTLPASIA